MQEDLFEKALIKGADLIRAMLLDYKESIKRAFMKVDADKSITVNLAIKIKGYPSEELNVQSVISFVESKVKDMANATVSRQERLFLEGGR